MTDKYDLIIAGAGILGTFHAYHALQKNLKVLILEKDKRPQGATTRNFGQVVPSGMNSKWQSFGRKSLEIYADIQSKCDISVRKNGSIYLASNEEELQLLEELNIINQANDYKSFLFTKEECLQRYNGLRSDYVIGGLFFPEEITVEPTIMIHRMLDFLIEQYSLEYRNNAQVIVASTVNDSVQIETADGDIYRAAKFLVCNGSDCKALFPEIFWNSDLVVTKLQMMQTVPQSNYHLPGSILTGLSIRRYEAFHECPSWSMIKEKEASDTPAKKWGVHILFKQATDGSVIIGDSHEYADINNIDDLGYDLKEEINAFMLEEAKKIFDLPDYSIQRKWFGVYSQCKLQDIFEAVIDENIHIITGIGGKGMTGSPGFAKQSIETLFNKN